MRTEKAKAAGIIFGISLLVLWQTASVVIAKSYILPGPADVIKFIINNFYALFAVHFPATIGVVAAGMALSVITGILLAVLMDLEGGIERAVYPILTITQTIPVMCAAPVFVLWFGYSFGMRVFVVVIVNFFTVAINLFDGFKSVNTGLTELVRTYGTGKLRSIAVLKFPAALPNFFTALKIIIPWSMTAAAISEWLGSPAGLGMYSRNCMMEFNCAGVIAPLAVMAAVSLVLIAVVGKIENKVVFWRSQP